MRGDFRIISYHVQAPCSWSADFSIGTGCAFDGTGSGSNDDFGLISADLDYLHHVGDEEHAQIFVGLVRLPATRGVTVQRDFRVFVH
jgi:hypothetical protein